VSLIELFQMKFYLIQCFVGFLLLFYQAKLEAELRNRHHGTSYLMCSYTSHTSKFPKRKVIVREPFEIFGANLVDLQEWADKNDGYKYLLNVIYLFSRYAWSIPLKDKSAPVMIYAFKSLFSVIKRDPKHLWIDRGTEFYNTQVKSLMKQHNVKMYSTGGDSKCVFAEAFNKSLKRIMWKYFTAHNTRRYID
jgi:hypothetical protein